MNTFKVQKRDMETKAKKLRREGYVTGNLFGKEIEGSVLLKIERKEAERMQRECMKGSQVMLDLDGQSYDVLIKDMDYDPAKNMLMEIDFQALEKSITVHPEDYIVIVTRGHLCDTDAERFALHTDAGYIGVVGSRRKAKIVYDKLVAEGFSQKQLSRVITPIGLDIGSETPAEIAVSIAAQMIQFRANK